MGISEPPKTGFPASEKPSPIERTTKKDKPRKSSNLRVNLNQPRLCGNCGGTGRTVDPDNAIHFCDVCNGDGIG